MRSSVRFAFARVLAWSAALAVVAGGVASAQDEKGVAEPAGKVLTVCAVPASMPRADKAADGTGRGLDVALVRLLGRRLGRPIEFHWCASAECSWHCLPERRCDLVIGQP